jgi:hypothetical protein
MSAVPVFDPIKLAGGWAAIIPGKRFLFVCGLHRSGTTLITRCLAQHPMISAFANTGAIEDEGQFLQSVLPLETEFGGVGRFGFDPRAHMTEEGALNTHAAAAQLLSAWRPYWNADKTVLMEKTPSNLLRMRLLARLFEPSSFIVVTRHPVATSLATLKWTEGNLFSLISHWVHCYRIARDDASRVDRVLWISYEAFVTRPREELARLVQFLGLPAHSDWTLAPRNDNAMYFDLWHTHYFAEGDRAIEQVPPERKRGLATRLRERLERDRRERSLPPHRRRENLRDFRDAQDAVALFEPAVREFGYSLTDLTRSPHAQDP